MIAIRSFFWIILRLMYRVNAVGTANIPTTGGAVLVANHVSFLDAIIIATHVRRPVSFVMHWRIYDRAPWLFAALGAVPIAPVRENRAVYEAALPRLGAILAAGGLVCLFPEGMLTRTGAMGRFKPGVRTILEQAPSPVVPIGLGGLWKTYFSRHRDGFAKIPIRIMGRVTMNVGEALPANTSLRDMESAVRSLVVETVQ